MSIDLINSLKTSRLCLKDN